jgi:hypothetical protein
MTWLSSNDENLWKCGSGVDSCKSTSSFRHLNDSGGVEYGQTKGVTNFNNKSEHENSVCAKMVPENPPVFSWKTNTNSQTCSSLTRSCPVWLFLFPKLKSSLKGNYLQLNEDIHKKMAGLLKAFSQNYFKKCFEAWKACIGWCASFWYILL